jgi:hypothetical protein
MKLLHQQTRVWTGWWLRHLPWRELRDMTRWARTPDPSDSSIVKGRRARVLAEWQRRKRESGGEWAS